MFLLNIVLTRRFAMCPKKHNVSDGDTGYNLNSRLVQNNELLSIRKNAGRMRLVAAMRSVFSR